MKPTVLIAEDDRVLSQLLSVRLRKIGFEVVVAFDAMQAFMVALRMAPAAILLDINMPGGTGMQVLKKLKNSTKTSHIPVIVLSGSVHPDVGELAKQLGAEEFFSKPADFELVQALLERLVAPAVRVAS